MEISRLGSDERSYFETFIRSPKQFLNNFRNRTGEDMGQFSAGPVNKAVPSFTSSLIREYVNGDGRYSKHLSLLKKVFALNGVCTVVNS